MKKIRICCLLLCLILTLQCAVAPVSATEAENTTADSTETATVPETTGAVYDIPEQVTGNAAVSNGCATIDGKQALVTDSGLARTAKGAFLYDMATGTVLYAKNPDEKLYPASLTKIMTALIALERADPEEIVTVSVSAVADMDPEATLANLVPGEEMSMLDLFRMKGIVTSILSLGLYCTAEHLLGTWGATYIVNVFCLPPEVAAKWVSLYYGGIMLGRIIAGFLSEKATDNMLIKWGAVVSLFGMAILALPLGTASLMGFLLVGIGFGPIFPSVIHSVPVRFGATYSADLTGYHMGGAYVIGYIMQLVFGYVASATTFAITPFVLLALCTGVLIANGITVNKLK